MAKQINKNVNQNKKIVKKKDIGKKRIVKPYAKEQLQEAVDKVNSGLPVATVSKACGVPRTTLDNKVSEIDFLKLFIQIKVILIVFLI